MSEKIKPMSPVRVPLRARISLGFLTIILPIIWGSLLFAAAHLFVYYFYSVYTNGVCDPESLKYGAMVAVGAYFCVIIDRHKIEATLNLKNVDKNLPFIPKEDIEEQDHNQKNHLLDYISK